MRAWFQMVGLSLLVGCGTTYQLPELTEERIASAEAVISREETATAGMPQIDADEAASNFFEVIYRVEPVAEKFCREQKAEEPSFNCDVQVVVDDRIDVEPNAFQYFDDAGEPTIMFNVPFIAKARNQDELAFVFGHEMGHLIGDHIEKREQQQMAGAVIAGLFIGLSQAAANYGNPYRSTTYDQANMRNAMVAGGEIGSHAYSQTYELEADLVGSYIAERAGYDPELGARIFARREDAENVDGSLSFWGTHPKSAERIATVAAAVDRIAEQRRSGLIPSPN